MANKGATLVGHKSEFYGPQRMSRNDDAHDAGVALRKELHARNRMNSHNMQSV